MIFQRDSYARQPISHFIEFSRQLRTRFRRRDLGDFASATIELCERSDCGLTQTCRQWQQRDRNRQRDDDCDAAKNYSLATSHTLEGESPENRLSYIGTTCVVGQRNVPAAVARARTE